MSDKVKKIGLKFTLFLGGSIGLLYVGMAVFANMSGDVLTDEIIKRDRIIGVILMVVGFVAACITFWLGQKLKEAKNEQAMLDKKEEEKNSVDREETEKAEEEIKE